MANILLTVLECNFGLFEFGKNAICLEAGYAPLPNSRKITPVYILAVAVFFSSILNVILLPFRRVAQ